MFLEILLYWDIKMVEFIFNKDSGEIEERATDPPKQEIQSNSKNAADFMEEIKILTGISTAVQVKGGELSIICDDSISQVQKDKIIDYLKKLNWG